jgi:hypothetical protein
MNENTLLDIVNNSPESLHFKDIIACIDTHYHFEAVSFHNNGLDNPEGTNLGSCKIFAFAKLHGLTKDQTLALFAEHYFKDVVIRPEAESHQNIRHFMNSEKGVDGVILAKSPLTSKA